MSNWVWVDLPEALVERISDLCLPPDYIRMQSVCKSWQAHLKKTEDSANYVAYYIVDKHFRVDNHRGTVLIQKKFRDPSIRISKVALSDDGNMVVVVIYGFGELAFCRIGDEARTHIESPRWMNHIQIIYHKGQFYSLEYQGPISHLLIEDSFIPQVVEVARVPHYDDGHSGLAYFVGDILTECLFVIFRELKYNYESSKFITRGFHIYEVVPSLSKVREVKSLGDRIMLLGCNSSLIVMAREFPSFKGNCIYFANSYDFSHVLDWCRHPTTLWQPLWIAISPYSLYSDFREKDVIGTTAGI